VQKKFQTRFLARALARWNVSLSRGGAQPAHAKRAAFGGFHHPISRHTPQFGKNLLPHVHRVAVLLKRWLLGTLHGSVGHHRLQSYRYEGVFGFNRRASGGRGLLFHRL